MASRYHEYIAAYNFMKSLPNVCLNFGPVKEGDHPLEQVYISTIMRGLSQFNDFNEYNFFILSANAPCNFTFDQTSVVLYLSNEDHCVPENILKAKAVFTPYCPLKNAAPHCFPIPLGYNGSLKNLPVKKISERSINVFFSGNLHRRRVPFYIFLKMHQIINKLQNKFRRHKRNELIQFNRTFTGGIGANEYSDILMNSKIALVPEGYKSDISFRFFEAAKYGCIIITTKLYDYWFFKNFPGIELTTWSKLHSEINKIQADKSDPETLHQRMLSYYETYCSENAVIKFIAEKIGLKNG